MKHESHEIQFSYISESGEQIFLCLECCRFFFKSLEIDENLSGSY